LFGVMREEDDGHPDGAPGKRWVGRRRYAHGRHRPILFRTSEEEYEQIRKAGELVSLTPSGFAADASSRAAEATLRAAGEGSGPPDRDLVVPDHATLREGVTKLMAASLAASQIGNNLNQAVKRFNATGEAPPWLRTAAEKAAAAVDRIDEESYELARRVGRAR
jgi:hypothetical protein